MTELRDARIGRTGELWARATDGATYHVPNNDAVHPLTAGDDLRTEACMDSGPSIAAWVGPRVCTDAPDHELMSMWRPFKDIRVVAVQASFEFDDCGAAASQSHRVVMPILTARGIPVADVLRILHVIQNVLYEFTLLAHRCRELAAYSFNSPTKKPAVIKLMLVEAVPA